MYKYNAYYLIFFDKSKRNHTKNQYNKLSKDISRLKILEFKLFNKTLDNKIDDIKEDSNSIININNSYNLNNSSIHEAKKFVNFVKKLLDDSIKQINNYENDSLKIYYLSMQNYFSIKGLLISKKYKLLEEYYFFQKINQKNEEVLSKQILKDKQKMSKPIINKTENKLFNYFNYEILSSKKIIKTLSTIGLLSLTIISILFIKKKYKK